MTHMGAPMGIGVLESRECREQRDSTEKRERETGREIGLVLIFMFCAWANHKTVYLKE